MDFDAPLRKRMNQIAEEIFGTHEDPNQIQIKRESAEKLDSLTKDWLVYELDKSENPISWIVVVPTTKEIAEKFLHKEITERQLLEMTSPQKEYSALYLCSAITVPEHRRQGLAEKLLKEAINKIPKTNNCILFAWPFSEEGNHLIKKMQNYFDIKTPS